MRRRFFVERFEGDSTSLTGETAEHLSRVLRAEQGQVYELSDSREVWLGRIEGIDAPKRGPASIRFKLIEKVPIAAPRFAPKLLVSIVKFDRFEWCLEKATELGAAEIVPLIAARTDKPLAQAALKRHARWQKILVESAQQSRRVAPPILRPAAPSEIAFAAESSAPLKLLLSERPGGRLISSILPAEIAHLSNAALAIGPEGGWTEREFEAAATGGFTEASLGENILRTETAVLASLAMLRFACPA